MGYTLDANGSQHWDGKEGGGYSGITPIAKDDSYNPNQSNYQKWVGEQTNTNYNFDPKNYQTDSNGARNTPGLSNPITTRPGYTPPTIGANTNNSQGSGQVGGSGGGGSSLTPAVTTPAITPPPVAAPTVAPSNLRATAIMAAGNVNSDYVDSFYEAWKNGASQANGGKYAYEGMPTLETNRLAALKDQQIVDNRFKWNEADGYNNTNPITGADLTSAKPTTTEVAIPKIYGLISDVIANPTANVQLFIPGQTKLTSSDIFLGGIGTGVTDDQLGGARRLYGDTAQDTAQILQGYLHGLNNG